MALPLALITGPGGLIGSEVCRYFHRHGFRIAGLDNNQRAVFFGPEGDTSWTLRLLRESIPDYQHHAIDIRDRAAILSLVAELTPAAIIHTAAQPSHDRAAAIPFDDFDTNATGTLNLLEAARRACPEAPFVHMSTNKVYGDLPNSIRLKELDTRWEIRRRRVRKWDPETFSIDQSKHSSLELRKWRRTSWCRNTEDISACDVLPAGRLLHRSKPFRRRAAWVLELLIKCNLEGREYRIYGYKGKQVRDNLHSEDAAGMMLEFCKRPRSGEVYNLGGGKANSCSIWEAFRMTEEITGRKQRYTYVEQTRRRSHLLLQRSAQA